MHACIHVLCMTSILHWKQFFEFAKRPFVKVKSFDIAQLFIEHRHMRMYWHVFKHKIDGTYVCTYVHTFFYTTRVTYYYIKIDPPKNSKQWLGLSTWSGCSRTTQSRTKKRSSRCSGGSASQSVRLEKANTVYVCRQVHTCMGAQHLFSIESYIHTYIGVAASSGNTWESTSSVAKPALSSHVYLRHLWTENRLPETNFVASLEKPFNIELVAKLFQRCKLIT
jgi:hypothetical protein